ncbi:MAG TPA: hypothetical protein VGC53_20520 [Vicinamibacteria bacterium]|jgi:ABC-type transporter Mla maintaining outer membrane lipid asymmetry ATPase subunit MlaF
MNVVTPKQMERILELTDSMAIHREAVVVPLGPEGQGRVRLVRNKIEITVPEEGDFEAWLRGLPAAIAELDLTEVRRAET